MWYTILASSGIVTTLAAIAWAFYERAIVSSIESKLARAGRVEDALRDRITAAEHTIVSLRKQIESMQSERAVIVAEMHRLRDIALRVNDPSVIEHMLDDELRGGP